MPLKGKWDTPLFILGLLICFSVLVFQIIYLDRIKAEMLLRDIDEEPTELSDIDYDFEVDDELY